MYDFSLLLLLFTWLNTDFHRFLRRIFSSVSNDHLPPPHPPMPPSNNLSISRPTRQMVFCCAFAICAALKLNSQTPQTGVSILFQMRPQIMKYGFTLRTDAIQLAAVFPCTNCSYWMSLQTKLFITLKCLPRQNTAAIFCASMRTPYIYIPGMLFRGFPKLGKQF